MHSPADSVVPEISLEPVQVLDLSYLSIQVRYLGEIKILGTVSVHLIMEKVTRHIAVKQDPKRKQLDITAKSWLIYDVKSQTIRREIASLTKMMTLLVIIRINEKISSFQSQIATVPEQAVRLGGTTADLQEGDRISVIDLIYGMMLPSGNDAAYTLAYHFGKQLAQGGQPIDSFVKSMNDLAQDIGMKNSYFTNPHGLSDRNSYSCAADVLILSKQLIQQPLARRVIQKKNYFCCVQGEDTWTKQLFWDNTNKLLQKGFKGIKTGSTKSAGYCLSLWHKTKGEQLLLVTLSSRDTQKRWEDNLTLFQWWQSSNC